MSIDATTDTIWQTVLEEVQTEATREPLLASFLYSSVLRHSSLEAAAGYLLATRLGCNTMDTSTLRDMIAEAFASDDWLGEALRADLMAVRERDPACTAYCIPLLYLKGFKALQSFRVSHWLWERGRHAMAYYLQSRIATVFAVDVHPAARIGKGILFDHATGIVIGETAVVGDNVSMLHEVTLGGTGKQSGDRHPKIGPGVLIGAGAKILGNIRIGEGAKVGAGSVVLDDVPPHSTVVGVPAKVVGHPHALQPALDMDQSVRDDQ